MVRQYLLRRYVKCKNGVLRLLEILPVVHFCGGCALRCLRRLCCGVLCQGLGQAKAHHRTPVGEGQQVAGGFSGMLVSISWRLCIITTCLIPSIIWLLLPLMLLLLLLQCMMSHSQPRLKTLAANGCGTSKSTAGKMLCRWWLATRLTW